MASSVLPAPGTTYGPCVSHCKHIDCRATKLCAESPCTICRQAIGYDSHFYQADDGMSFKHRSCVEEELDKAERDC